MFHAPLNGKLVDGFLHSAVDEIEPHIRFLLLANTVHSCDGLEFQGCVQEWFAEEDVTSVDEIQPGRVGSGVEEKTFDAGVLLELFDSVRFVDGRKADSEALECACKDCEEIFELRVNDAFAARVGFTEPDEMAS